MTDLANGAVYGARPIKRRRRTKGEVEQLERQILAVLEQDRPQSIRHVFYRMTDPRLPEPVEKTDRGYNHVQHRLTMMRREGKIAYSWLSDTTRRGYNVATYRNGAEFLLRHTGLYRADLWADSGVHVEIWTESRSLAGVVERDCRELAVSLYPCGGFASITFACEAAREMQEGCGRYTWPWIDGDEPEDAGRGVYHQDIPAHVIFIGDYDPAGVLIDHSLEAELRHHLPAGFALEFSRLAITPEQITAHDLPTKPRKESDRRARHIQDTVEAEAMPANVLRALLRDKIESFLPPRALEVAKAAEQSERQHLRRWAELMARSAS